MSQLIAILILGMLSAIAVAANEFRSHLINFSFHNLRPDIRSVYYGEYVAIPVLMNYSNLKNWQIWHLPAHVSVQVHTPHTCPPFFSSAVNLHAGMCSFSLIIQGAKLGQIISGLWIYQIKGNDRDDTWDFLASIDFSLSVIPHPLSIAEMPLQYATANLPVFFDLRTYINYHEENILANNGTVLEVYPLQVDGLYYDPSRFAIVGSPTRVGSYQFKISARSNQTQTQPFNLNFEVGFNKRDKPIFNKNYQASTVTAGKPYQLNLLQLLKKRATLMTNNPVHFRIDKNVANPNWLRIDQNDSSLLVGNIPVTAAGTIQELSIIASSNTGGDSEPYKITIPIASDPANSPLIKPFSINEPAGMYFEYDVGQHIFDPISDNSLKLIINRVEPKAPWLHLSSSKPTLLVGIPPLEMTGQTYQLSLQANTKNWR
ncbi:MAG: hypothetical protein H0U70_12480 [Tatlockia sp.]|nr:hypothetical protein [Tatlockia sp.]